VRLSVVTSIECEFSQQGEMTELTPILNSVQKPNHSLLSRHVPLKEVSSIESECSEQGYMTELTTIANSVHTSKEIAETTRATYRDHQHRK
jgi:hypothetical protein